MSTVLHPNSVAKVHIERLLENLRTLRERTRPDVRSMAVIKADAYGHGAVEVARHLEDHVSAFAVSNVDEGIELRESGIERPILVFGAPSDLNAPAYLHYDLTATVSSFEHFRMLPEGVEYHINIDTGMGRYGFIPSQIERVKESIRKKSSATCKGIYSHFATADLPDSEKVYEQLRLFKSIRTQFDSDLLTHIANSGGGAFYRESHFDMIRYGISLYGYNPGTADIEGLQPVMDWISFLAQVKPIEEDMTVSYRATWRAPRDGYLGVIPVGYGDGVSRNLSNNFGIYIRKQYYPVVGIVTMDNIMVYLGQEALDTGEKVILLSKDTQTAHDWARKLDTIPYEILCRVTSRVKRVYVY